MKNRYSGKRILFSHEKKKSIFNFIFNLYFICSQEINHILEEDALWKWHWLIFYKTFFSFLFKYFFKCLKSYNQTYLIIYIFILSQISNWHQHDLLLYFLALNLNMFYSVTGTRNCCHIADKYVWITPPISNLNDNKNFIFA